MPITDSSSEYIHPALAALTLKSYQPGGVKLLLPGGEVHIVDGVWRQMPNGVRDMRFVPKEGAQNMVTVEPPSPILTAPKSTPVPAQRGLKLGVLGGAASVGIAFSILEMMEQYRELFDMQSRHKFQDMEMIGWVISGIDPDLEPLRNPNPQKRRKRMGGDGNKRVRIHGYSRRKA